MGKPETDVTRLFPFALRARILIHGRAQLDRARSRLHFILITQDIAPRSRREILHAFGHYPVLQRYSASDLERFFQVKNTKILGFAKSDLAKSIYREMRDARINPPRPDCDDPPPDPGQPTDRQTP